MTINEKFKVLIDNSIKIIPNSQSVHFLSSYNELKVSSKKDHIIAERFVIIKRIELFISLEYDDFCTQIFS